MKKMLTMLLVLSLCLLPMVTAQAETEGNPQELVRMLAQMNTPFDGAPDAELAWAVMSTYANRFDTENYSREEMQELYDSLFARGSFDDIAGVPSSLFGSDGNGGYTLSFADGEGYAMIAVNAMNEREDGTLEVDFSSWTDIHGGWDEFRCNGTAVLEADETSAWGYRALSYASDDAVIGAFTDIAADAVLDDQYDFNYAPKNIADGDLSTCWAYTGSSLRPALTLASDAMQEVRGIAITAGYAKNEDIFRKNNRVKTLEVTFGDGTGMSFALDEVETYDGLRVLPFNGIVVTDSITIRVTDVYAGSKYDDVCISELIVF